MSFLKEIHFGRAEWLIMFGVVAAGLLIAGAAGAFTPHASTPATSTPSPSELPAPGVTSVALAATATSATVSAAAASPAPAPTAAELPAPGPTATWFYAAPHTLDFAPTPVLPPAAPFPESCDGPGRMNILLVGLDGFSNDYDRPARTDTIMLVGVNFSARTVQMLSLPRDLWVAMPNGIPVTEARINSAYHYGELYAVPGGGPAQLKASLEQVFGVRVDRYAVVSFLAFEQAIDAIGGIEIDIPEPIHDPKYPRRSRPNDTIAIDFPAGRVQMDGGTALIYARIRHDSSDFNRMRRQQQVLFAVRDKLLRPETLPHLPALAQLLYSSVRTDLTLDDIALLGCLGPRVDRGAIQTTVIGSSLVTPTTLADGAQVLLPQLDALLPVLQSFNAGE